MKRYSEVKEKSKAIDVCDLWQHPVIRFQQKHFILLTILIHIILPSTFAYFVLGSDLRIAIFCHFFTKYMISLNMLWCTNSLLHYWGYKSYNKTIMARENAILGFFLVGEGWHNFHHMFPWDYCIGEFGKGYQLPAYINDVFAKIGLAYDLKTASPEIIQKVPEIFLHKKN